MKFKVGDAIFITNEPDRGLIDIVSCIGIITEINKKDCIFYVPSINCHGLWLPIEELVAPTDLIKALL